MTCNSQGRWRTARRSITFCCNDCCSAIGGGNGTEFAASVAPSTPAVPPPSTPLRTPLSSSKAIHPRTAVWPMMPRPTVPVVVSRRSSLSSSVSASAFTKALRP